MAFDSTFKSPAEFEQDFNPLPGGPLKKSGLGRTGRMPTPSDTRLASKSVTNSFLRAVMTAADAVTKAANTVKSVFEHRDAQRKHSRTLNAEAMKRLADGIPEKLKQFSDIYESIKPAHTFTFDALRPLLDSMGLYLSMLEDKGITNFQTEAIVSLKAQAVHDYASQAMETFRRNLSTRASVSTNTETLKARLVEVMKLGSEFTWLKKHTQHFFTAQEIINVYQLDKNIDFLQTLKKDTQAKLLQTISNKTNEQLTADSSRLKEILAAARDSIAWLNLERNSKLYSDAVKVYKGIEGNAQALYRLRQFYENDSRIKHEQLNEATKLSKRIQALQFTMQALDGKIDSGEISKLKALQESLTLTLGSTRH